jgi:hypothetical protein
MEGDHFLRQELTALLRGGHAHMDFHEAVGDFPLKQINSLVPGSRRPPGDVPFSPWHLLEHMRIAQWDILEFIRNPSHRSPRYPEGYWPSPEQQADAAAWERSIRDFRSDLNAVLALVEDPLTQLLSPLPHARDFVLLREIMLVADHNAYHIGQFGILRDVLGS